MKFRRSATATFRNDGTVDIDLWYPSKTNTQRVLDWTLAGLWFLSGAVLIAAMFAI